MPEDNQVLEGIIYKGTTLPHICVRRKCILTSEGFTTFQSDKNVSSGKLWQLHRRTTLEPVSPSQIRLHERHLRKAGPLRALSAYARDKNVLKLFCFRVEWPDKYAPHHGSSVELGFESLDQARTWHLQISAYVTALGGSNSGSLQTQYSIAGNSNSSLNGGMYGGTGYVSAEPSPFTSPVASFPSTPALLSKQPSMATDGCLSPIPASGALDSSNSNALGTAHRNSSSQDFSAAGGSGLNLKALNTTGQAPVGSAGCSGSSSSSSSSNAMQSQQSQQSGSAAALAAAMRAHAQSFGGQCGRTGQQSSSNTGVVVDECMVRWVPYKHANGMAIYYRQTPQEEGKGMPQASGEYMLSTSVQASPECCVSNLMLKADKNGSVLSTAAFMEVLEDNGDMQVWHMVFHPAGSAGVATVLAAPRYTFMHQVLTSYEEGVYAVLFSSVPDEDVKPEWIERANARTQRAHRAVLRSDPGSGSRKPLWRTPVRCRITGAITLSALEGRSGRDSPQTLVTCIVRADFGGWLGSKSMFYGMGQALGLQEALMDRVLMRVMILKEDVEYSRFKTKPFQLLMVQPEDYDSNNKQQSSSSSSSCSGSQQQQQQQQQQQLAALRMASAAGQGALSQQQQQQQQQAECLQPVVSLQLPPSRRTTSANSTGQGPAIASTAPGTPTGDLMQRTQSAAGAVAVAAAARVSAAASALAAHMTNPQQLWHEKRGSQSGFSASNTPPHSPSKQSLAGGPPVSGLLSKHTSSAAAEVIAAAAPPGVVLGKAATAAAGQHQRQRIEVSAEESTDIAAGPPAAAAERYYSMTGSPAARAAAAVAEAEEAPTAGGAAERIQEEEEGEEEAFEEADDASESRDGAAAADADVAVDSSSSSGHVMPYSEAQLEGMIGGTLNRQYWESIHDGVGSVRDVYSIRGPNYLKDRKKVPAGKGRYKLMAADLVATEHMMDHIGRYLPSVRCNGAAFSFVVDLIINYGSPVLHLVMVFSTDRHPNSLGPCPDDPLDAGEEWTPFDFTMSRFLHGTDDERNGMFKLIPHCAKGSWVVSQSVGTTPVILGRKLATTYHTCDRYIEVDVDVASTQAVAYIVKMVQGATRSMLIDHAYLLESQFAHELPEQLIGAIRYKHLDMTDYSFVNIDNELPFSPVVPGIVGQ